MINNAFEMELWRKNIGKLLSQSKFKDDKEGLIAYILFNYPDKYKKIDKDLPINVNDLSWKQLADLIGELK